MRLTKQERKEKLRALHDAQEREHTLAHVRHPQEDVGYRGVGLRRLQLVRKPSLSKTLAWEIRELNNNFTLFRSESPEPDQYLLSGYVQLEVASAALANLLFSFQNLSLSVFPNVSQFGVADGTRLEICIEVTFGTQFRAIWMEGNVPAEWVILERNTQKMLEFFQTAMPVQ